MPAHSLAQQKGRKRGNMRAVDYIRKGWIQGRLAVDSTGESCWYRSKGACRWCTLGAMYAAYPSTVDFNEAYVRLFDVIGNVEIEMWNDDPDRTQAEVIEAMEKANI
jgi:hypothetical protein